MMKRFDEVNRSTFLAEALLRGYSIVDCVVNIDMQFLPAVVEVKLKEKDEVALGSGKRNPPLLFSCQLGAEANGASTIHTVGFFGDWLGRQAQVRSQMENVLNRVKTDPVLLSKTLAELKKKYVL